MVREWKSALASLVNWRVRNQPFFCGELFGFFDHAGAAGGAGGDDDLGAEEAHELAALDGEGFGHGDDEGVAFGGADHGEADAGVAAGGFDDGLAGLEGATLFGVFDDAEGEAVFDGAEGVEGFDLDVEVDAGGGEVVDADDGGVADGAEDVVELVFHRGGSFVIGDWTEAFPRAKPSSAT